MTEQWRPVVGFEGLYEASDAGCVKSVKRIVPRVDGRPLSVKERVLRPSRHKQGYLQVTMSKDGRRYCDYVHRIVARSFLGEPPDGHLVCHLDNNPAHNAVSNLIYGTQNLNMKHRDAHGNTRRGDKHSRAKLTSSDIVDIRSLHAFGARKAALAECFGVSRTHVGTILTGDVWAHI